MTPAQKRDALDIEQAEHLKKLLQDVLTQTEMLKKRGVTCRLQYNRGWFSAKNGFDFSAWRSFKHKEKTIINEYIQI